MRKKHLMQFRKAMAAFLAVAMIGQNSLVTTAESYVVEDQAIVAQEENQYEQEPQGEVQQEQPVAQEQSAVQEQPVAQEQVQAEQPVVQEEPAVPMEEGKTEPQGEEPPSGDIQENPTVPQENPENPEGKVQEAGAVEKQGENNGQAASENPTQENGETTPVETTYHITFDSHAADHGKIQVQGEASPIESVSAYNKELKENERFAFSVIAENGYEVEKVCLADTGAELSKNAEGLYEISAVTKDVKIEVVYKEIPQPAAPEPEVKEPQSEGEAPQENQSGALTEMNQDELFAYLMSLDISTAWSLMEDDNVVAYIENTLSTDQLQAFSEFIWSTENLMVLAADEGQLTVKAKDTEGNDLPDQKITVGQIVAPNIDGYTAVNAKVGKTIVTAVAKAGDVIYVTVDDNQLAGIRINDSTEITLYYEKIKTKYSVSYVVKAGKETLDTDVLDNFIGAEKVTEGKDLEFSFGLKKGYTLKSVTVDGNKVTGDASGKYVVSNVTKALDVVITLEKAKTYNFTFTESSNTIMQYAGKKWYSGNGGTHYTESSTYPAFATSIDFTLSCFSQYAVKGGALNKLVLTIDGVKYTAETPASTTSTAPVVTVLANGITVTVTKTGEADVEKGSGTAPIYQVKLARTEGICGDITVITNYKTSESSEIWVKQLDGIVSPAKVGDKELHPDVFEFYNRTPFTDSATNVWFKVADGYDKNTVKVKVLYDGVEKIETVTASSSANYDFSFTIPADTKSTQYKDIRIYITAQKLEKNYSAKFVSNNKTVDSSSASYKLNSNFAITNTSPAPYSGYVFSGWKLGEKVYMPGQIFTITDLNESLAVKESGSGNYVFTFEAYWIPEAEAEKAEYSIQIFYERESADGNYEDLDKLNYLTEPDLVLKEFGVKDKEAFVIESKIESKVREAWKNSGKNPIEDWDKKYELDKKSSTPDLSKLVLADGSAIIKLYYRLRPATVEIIGEHEEHIYTGAEEKVSGYTVDAPTEVTVHLDSKGKDTASGKDADTHYMGLTKADFTVTSSKYGKIKVKVTDGYLTITKRNVTLTSASDEKIYDGTALTNSDVIVSGDGFVNGEGATYNVTGSQTNVGESENTFTYALNKGTKAKNYTIIQTPGNLKVTPVTDKVTVTITGKTGTEKYDGAEKSVSGYDVESDNNLYTEKDFEFSGIAEAKGTDANGYEMGLKVGDFKNTSKNFTNVEFKVEDGKLTIQPRVVTLTSASDRKVYDGKPLTNNNVTVGGEGFVGNDGATYNVTGSRTEVGKSDNKFTYSLKDGTKAQNYAIETYEGILEVTANKNEVVVTITEHEKTEKYDGTEKSVSGYDVKSNNSLYTEKDFTFSGKAEVKQTNAGIYGMNLKESDFKNTNSNFEKVTFVIEHKNLVIEKREVELISADANKVYDGQPLTKNIVTVSGDRFADGEGASYAVTGSQTNVGKSDNKFTYTLNKGTSADNYIITKTLGTLEVTPVTNQVTVTITGNKASVKYSGEEQKVNGYNVATNNPLYTVNDFTFKGDATAKGTNADAYKMGLKKADFENTSKNFTSVVFEVTDGKLTIEPRKVSFTSASAKKVYDGEPLTNNNVTVGGEDGFVNGEGATFNVTGSQTDVGSSSNTFTFELNEGTLEQNYDIETHEGTLAVTANENEVVVTITEHSATVKYDGTEHTVTGYDVNISNPLYTEKDFTFTGKAEAKGKNADTYDMELTAANFKNTNKNFDKVTFKIVDGGLVIEKREVELTSASAEKVYDGTPLTNDTVTVSKDGFVKGEGASYDVTGTQTEAGKSDNEFTYTLNQGTLAKNYTITETPGTLKVKPVADQVVVTITGHTDTVKYDGTEKSVTGYDVAINNELYTVNDFTFEGTDTAAGTNADDYNMGLNAANFKNISDNFTYVVFAVTDGKLTIEPRNVSLTSASDNKVYDGQPLTNNNVTVGGDGFAKGEGATYNVTGSQTNVGRSDNKFTYTLNKGTQKQNYIIETYEGILVVTANADEVVVTITGHNDTVKYDGIEHTVAGYDVDINNPLYTESDFTFSGNAEAKGKNADKYDMNLTEGDFENINKNFDKVTFVVVDGSLVIEKREVELTSANASKVYDRTPLTNDTVTVSKDGFADGEGATYKVTGSQTEVGKSDNEFTYTLNKGTLANNYDITATPGSLEVTPVTDEVIVTITENGKTFTYDGKEKSASGYTVSINTPLYTENDFTFNGFAEVSGINAGKYDMELTPDDFENINGNFEKVTFIIEDGILEILPAELTFRAGSDSKKYDGEPLTCAKYELVKGTIAEGQTEQVTVEGSQTLVGTSANVITAVMILAQIDKEFVDVTDNYEIIKENGELEVTDGTDTDPVDPEKVVTKTHEEKAYELGEKVTFTIRVQNIYDTVKTIRIEELAGVTIKGAAPETPNILEVSDVGAGEFVEVEATYVVTEADIAKGHFENTVKVKFIDGKPFENKDTVVTVDPVKNYTLEKKASESSHESGKFKAGETIHYTITVKNTGNQTLEKIEIQDTLQAAGTITNIQGAEYIQDGKITTFTIRNLAPQTEETQITYDYIVLEADKGNTISNAVVGSPAEPDGKTPEEGTHTEVEDPKVEVKKAIVSITAADGTQKDIAGKADKDDVITYSVTVTNTGNVKLTAAKITDSLEGIQLPEGQSFELGNLECGESKSVTYTYVVKEADLGKNILNIATATAEVPEDPEDTPKPEGKDEKEVPTEDPANCSIVVTKQLVNIQGDLLSVASAQFYVSLFADEAMTQKVGETKAITFGENQGTMSVTFDQLKRGVYYVAETDAEGNVITSGTYNNGSFVPQYGNGNKVEITENGATAEFKFNNQFLILPDEYYMVKTITITKNVLKKNGEKLKSDETFYAGIFTDAEHTQLADMVSENIVPLAMNGKAAATKAIDVTVPIGGEEVTLYITEVTADGTPVERDDAFEYDVEVAGDIAVLSENSENAEVVITNTSRKDEPAEPTKPAEPTEAPEATITSAPENAVPVNGVKTGDDAPIGELTVVLLLSAAYLVIAAIRRRKTSGR